MLTYTDYQTAYPTSTVPQATVERWIGIYTGQLSNYFRFDDTLKSKFINIENCGQSKVYLEMPLIIDDSTLIEEYSIKTRMLTTLAKDVDFMYSTDTFDTVDYSYALDFECLNCICTCEKIKIKGIWGVLLPSYLELAIYNLIESKSQVLTTDPCQDIASEKIGEYNVTYRDTNTNTNTLDINNVYSIPLLSRALAQIQTHFLYV
jgi:hypothetical protein